MAVTSFSLVTRGDITLDVTRTSNKVLVAMVTLWPGQFGWCDVVLTKDLSHDIMTWNPGMASFSQVCNKLRYRSSDVTGGKAILA